MLREKIKRRGEIFTRIRNFFARKDVLECDTSLLQKYAVSDYQIHSLAVQQNDISLGYLITSPEYAMKKLLSHGSGDIYQLSHVFRGEELGRRHLREFCLLEWYRLNYSLEQLMQEFAELLSILLEDKNILNYQISTYSDLFKREFNINPFVISDLDLVNFLKDKLPETANWQFDRQVFLDLLFSHFIEPKLGRNCLEIISDYPFEQAALAKLRRNQDNNLVAARFEAYFKGIELCNAFEELNNSAEQRKRFIADNAKRKELGLKQLELDEELIAAVDKLPACCGIAVGVDRIIMLAENQTDINNIIL